MPAPVLTAAYSSVAEFLATYEAELSKRGLLVRGAALSGVAAMSECTLSVQVAGETPIAVPARVAAVVPGVGVAVMFEAVPAELSGFADRLRSGGGGEASEPPAPAGREDEEPRLLSERLKALNASQKMALALAADRQERMALLRDVNKVIHVYVLRNPRIGLDEVQWAAKNPNLSPDALKMMAEHKEWGSNAVVCTALVRNPRTPLPLALRLIDKIPASEVRAIAKGGARDQIVHACRKRISG